VQEKDKRFFKALRKIIEDTQRNRRFGHPEPLRENLSGWWSKKLDEGSRMIFRIVDGTVEIAECHTHYGDK